MVLSMSEPKPEPVAPSAPAPEKAVVPAAVPVVPVKEAVKAVEPPAVVVTQKIVVTATADLWVKVKIDESKTSTKPELQVRVSTPSVEKKIYKKRSFGN